jgi:hypothetical protein
MNLEFHYYIVHFLATRAGFPPDEAEVVACSSQFVDHNIISYRVISDNTEYRIEPTQNYGFWDDSFPREIYLPFHFFPGDPDDPRAARTDGGKNRFNTTPNSSRVKKLLVSALETRNLYRVGIALHTYADSWAHQNFTGRLEEWNRIEGAPAAIPPIGHAQAISKPDDSAIRWQDRRLVAEHREVDNRQRVIAAARQVYKYLCTFNRRRWDDLETVVWELEEILGSPGRKPSTTERISDFIIADSTTPYDRRRWLDEALLLPPAAVDETLFQGYSKVLWLRDALLYRSKLVEQRPVPAKPGFTGSHLYQWHEAAKAHRRTATELIVELQSS